MKGRGLALTTRFLNIFFFLGVSFVNWDKPCRKEINFMHKIARIICALWKTVFTLRPWLLSANIFKETMLNCQGKFSLFGLPFLLLLFLFTSIPVLPPPSLFHYSGECTIQESLLTSVSRKHYTSLVRDRINLLQR